MSFIDPKKMQEDDELPGSGVHVDLEAKICPTCRREALPWEARCPSCGVATIAPGEVPARDIPLPPGLRDLDEEDVADDLEVGEDPEAG